MPRQKDFKRRVRERMAKTGESYTAARLQLVNQRRSPEKKLPPIPPGAAKLAGMSDDAVSAKTGRDWAAWTRALDAASGVEMSHRDLAAHLADRHGLPGWWAQTVAVGYERIRGLREKGQQRSGWYEISKSKTVPIPIAQLYRAFATKRARDRWLGATKLVVRTSTLNKSMRMLWEDGSPVEVIFLPKGTAKSQVAIQHRKLASRAAADQLRRFWGERLEALASHLKSQGHKTSRAS